MIGRPEGNDTPPRGRVVTLEALSGLALIRPDSLKFNLEFVQPVRFFVLELPGNNSILDGISP